MGPLLYRTSRYNTVLKGNGKMKIGIITHHDVHNHGAQLQLYALVEVFRSLGHDAKALTYTKNYDFLSEEARVKYDVTARSIPYYASYLVRNGLAKTFTTLGNGPSSSSFARQIDSLTVTIPSSRV